MTVQPTDYEGPVPKPTADSQPYWDGLRAHRLLLQRCTACGRIRHYPRPVCDACYAFACDWTEASGRGTLHSWTVNHHAFHPAFRAAVPYVTVTVDLEEGVRVQAPLRDATDADLALGMPVEIAFEDVSEALTLPVVRLVTTK